MPAPPKTVAAICTEYRKWSHADVIVGKMLAGYGFDGGPGPNLKVVSLYLDQIPKNDTGRAAGEKHGLRLCDAIPDALTLGTGKLAVDGVVIIGEHGDYPTNDRGQKLYPRRRLFAAVVDTFDQTGKAVPVFSDKHLSAGWDDAKWMADAARKRMVPFLAGSSVPVTWRRPGLVLPKGCKLTAAVAVGYGQLEAYGFHALEGLQCMVERRAGGETGVKAVQLLTGKDVWAAVDAGRVPKAVLDAAAGKVSAKPGADYRTAVRAPQLMLVEYRDGLTAGVVLLNGFARDDDGGGFAFAGQLAGEKEPRACQFYLQGADPFAHFDALVRAIESLVHTGHAPYPVERTLLTGGVLDAIHTSKQEGGKRIETPHLDVRYQPTDWPPAAGPIPKPVKR